MDANRSAWRMKSTLFTCTPSLELCAHATLNVSASIDLLISFACASDISDGKSLSLGMLAAPPIYAATVNSICLEGFAQLASCFAVSRRREKYQNSLQVGLAQARRKIRKSPNIAPGSLRVIR
jgi:hypothetical protein